MKIRSIDPSHLIVVLSGAEAGTLGFSNEIRWQSLHVRLTVAKIFAAACARTHFVSDKSHISIKIASSADGETVLLFSALDEARKKYRIKEATEPSVYSFDGAKSMLDAVERLSLSGIDCGSSSLLQGESGYRLIVCPRHVHRKNIDLILKEYGILCGRGTAAAALAQEHGRLLAENAVSQIGKIITECSGSPF